MTRTGRISTHPGLVVLLLSAMAWAEPAAAPVPRGVYLYSWDVANGTPPPPYCTANCAAVQQLGQALQVNGVDGLTLVLDWSVIEPGPGVFIWDNQPNLFDEWVEYVATLGKSVNLTIRGGLGASGGATPSWLFREAHATRLPFDAAAHQGQGNCVSGSIAAPWDAAFQAQWQNMLAALSAHLQNFKTAAVSEMDTISMIRLTGINRTTDEFRLPEEVGATLASCTNPINSIQTWLYPSRAVLPYRPETLNGAWISLVNAFAAAFRGKFVNLPIIPNNSGDGQSSGVAQNPFPEIDDSGCVYDPPVDPTLLTPQPCTDGGFQSVDQNAPLLSDASQVFSNRFAIEYENLNTGSPANSYVVNMAQALQAGAAFQTNNWVPGGGAACSGGPGTGSPCPTAADYFNLIERGIYLPAPGSSPNFRAQFLEVFDVDVLRTPVSGPPFACAIWQAHVDLTDYIPPATTAIIISMTPFFAPPVAVNFKATDNSTTGQPNGCNPLGVTTNFQVDNGTWQTGSSAAITTAGSHTVRYYSTDVAGNVEPTHSMVVRVQ